jgi:hypothetical protein
MTTDITLNTAILRLYFSIALSDGELQDEEAGMIVDQAALIAKKIRAGPLPTRAEVEQILGGYLIDFTRYQGKNADVFPMHILQEAIDFIEEDDIRSSVLTQMLAITLADGSVHNNEMFLLKHIAESWGMFDEFSDFNHLVTRIFKPASRI